MRRTCDQKGDRHGECTDKKSNLQNLKKRNNNNNNNNNNFKKDLFFPFSRKKKKINKF